MKLSSPKSLIRKSISRAKRLIFGGKTERGYQKAMLKLKSGALEDAENILTSLVQRQETAPEWWHRLGFVQERRKEYEAAVGAYRNAIALNPVVGEWHYRAGVCAREIGWTDDAVGYFESAVRLDSSHVRAADALAVALRSAIPLWRKVELLELVCEVSETPSNLQKLAEHLFAFGKYQETATTLNRLSQLTSLETRLRIILGVALYRSGEVARSFEVFYELSNVKRFRQAKTEGIGYYFKARGDWKDAFLLYRQTWEAGNRNGAVAFGAAFCLDRQYKWEESLPWYRRALKAQATPTAYQIYKYAHALERCGRYSDAIELYARALSVGNFKQSDWFYRLAVCFYKEGLFEDALKSLLRWSGDTVRNFITDDAKDDPPGTRGVGEHFPEEDTDEFLRKLGTLAECSAISVLRQVPVDLSFTETRLELARLLRDSSDTASALAAYEDFTKSAPRIYPSVAAEIAIAYAQLGDFKNANDVLLESREFPRPDGLDLQKLTHSAYDRRRLLYAEFCERLPVDPSIVLFESYWGDTVSCNPLAIFEGMQNDERYSDKEFYWVVKPETIIPTTVQDAKRTFIVRYGTPRYERLLATAGSVLNNTSFPDYFVRRPGQIYVNTWHGTPLKTLGKRVNEGLFEHSNVARNFLNSSHLLVPNSHTAAALVQDYDISALFRGQAVTIGSPRLDKIVTATDSDRKKCLRDLNIEVPPGKRLLLFAPTWRGGEEANSEQHDQVVGALRALSAIPDTIVLFKAHHKMQQVVSSERLPVVVIPSNVDTYHLMNASDVLVTDYSSLLFDYLVTGRQVICYVPDLQSYEKERGLYLKPSDVIEDVAYSLGELLSLLETEEEFCPGPLYESSRAKYCKYEDGRATDRALDLIDTREESVPCSDPRTVLTFFTSMIPNGIFTALVGLISLLDRSKFRIVVVCDAASVKRDPSRATALERLPTDVEVIGRIGSTVATAEERWLISEFNREKGHVSANLETLLVRGYEREFRRIFGSVRNAVFIEYEGYSTFWTSLFALGRSESNRGYIFLHSQMLEEREAKHPYLATTMELYKRFDGVAAVSNATRTINSENVEREFGILPRPMVTVHNVLNSMLLKRKSEEIEDNIWATAAPGSKKIVMIGRLSHEKNHQLMLRAMPQILRQESDTHLLIIGSGPLRGELEAEVGRLNLRHHVTFAGQISNPMPTLKNSDLFVMTSRHEGMPMVILEAMTLGVPVLTTPVPGCVEAVRLGGDAGNIVEPNPESVANGVVTALASPASSRFQIDKYNSEALAAFAALVSDL